MRTLPLLLLLLVATAAVAAAQTTLRTTERVEENWDNDTYRWVPAGISPLETTFVFERDGSSFRHTTPTISSTYFIKSQREISRKVVEMSVMSDVGNAYTLVWDKKKKEMQFEFRGEGFRRRITFR